MNLKEYLKENNIEITDLTNLFSVGSVLDTVNGIMFPMMFNGDIDFDNPTNIIEDEISEDFINSLGWGEDVVFMDTLEKLR
jgi:hypothetical protein